MKQTEKVSRPSYQVDLHLITSRIGANKWTLQFRDPSVESAYLQNCLERGVYTGIITQYLNVFAIISKIAQSGVHLLTFPSYSCLSKEDINWALWSIAVIHSISILIQTIPFWVPKQYQLQYRYFGRFYVLCLLVSGWCHMFVWEMTMSWRVPVIVIDYPVSVIIAVACQAMICTTEGEFTWALLLPCGFFLARCASFCFLLFAHWNNMNTLISQSYGGSWLSIETELPILAASMVSCVLLGYWFNLFARVRYFAGLSDEAHQSASQVISLRSERIISAAIPPAEASSTSVPLPNQIVSNPMLNFDQRATEKSVFHSATVKTLWKAYVTSQHNELFRDYGSRNLVMSLKTGLVPIICTFCLNILQIDRLTEVQKVIITLSYFILLGIVISLQNWLVNTKTFDPFVRSNLINAGVVLIALTFHIPFIILYSGDTLLRSYCNLLRTAVSLGLTLSSLAGMQARATFLYVVILSSFMIVQVSLQPSTPNILITWSFVIMYLATSQLTLLITTVLEMQLFQFCRMRPASKSTMSVTKIGN